MRYKDFEGTLEELVEAELEISGQEDVYKDVHQAVERLLEIKALTPESGAGARILVLNSFIEERLEHSKRLPDTMKDDRVGSWELLNRLFLKQVCGEYAEGRVL